MQGNKRQKTYVWYEFSEARTSLIHAVVQGVSLKLTQEQNFAAEIANLKVTLRERCLMSVNSTIA